MLNPFHGFLLEKQLKIAYGSDIHLESWATPDVLPVFPDDCDALIIMGDLTSYGDGATQLARRYGTDRPIFYVPGNHEFYHSIYQDRLKAIQIDCDRNGIKFLGPDEAHEIDGVKFLGATLWTDYNLFGDVVAAMSSAGIGMSDHYTIGFREDDGNKWFLPRHALELHVEHLKWLIDECARDHNPRTAIVTHHLPSRMCIHPKWQGSKLNPAFASDVLHHFQDFMPALWFYGHSHDAMEVTIGGVRMLSNQLGYKGENHEDASGWSFKVVEI